MAGGSTDTVLVEETEGEGLYDGSSVLTNAMAPITPDFWRENLRRSVATQVRVALKTGQLTGGTSGTEKLDLRKEIQKPAPDAVVLAPDPEPVVETAELGLGRVAIWVCSLKPGQLDTTKGAKGGGSGWIRSRCQLARHAFSRTVTSTRTARSGSQESGGKPSSTTGPARTCREEQGSSAAATVCSWCRKEFAFLRAPAAQPQVPAPGRFRQSLSRQMRTSWRWLNRRRKQEAEPALEALAEE